METNRTKRNFAAGNEQRRCLSEVESDLVKAEDAFADADARLKAAKADLAAAIGMINEHQEELDSLIADMRRRSVPGTKWHPEGAAIADDRDALELGSENIVPEETRTPLVSPEKKTELSEKFARLKSKSGSDGDDPVLKVVYGPDD